MEFGKVFRAKSFYISNTKQEWQINEICIPYMCIFYCHTFVKSP